VHNAKLLSSNFAISHRYLLCVNVIAFRTIIAKNERTAYAFFDYSISIAREQIKADISSTWLTKQPLHSG